MGLLEAGLFFLFSACIAGLLWVDRSRRNRRLMQRLATLRRVPLSPGPLRRLLRRELFGLETQLAVYGVSASLLGSWLMELPPVFLLLSLVITGPLAWFLVRRHRLKKLRTRFAERFPEAVESLMRAVQSGVPMERALSSLGDIFDGPLGERFRHLVYQLEVGVPFRTALHNFSRGLDMPDVDFFCAVLALNRESGSQLSPMLVSLSRTLHDRRSVDRRLQALTAESRAAARVLAALPLFILGLQAVLNPNQLQFLLTDPTGRTILGVCAVCMLSGLFIIRRMSRLLEV